MVDPSPVLGLKMLSKGASYLTAAVLANAVHGAPAPLSLDRRRAIEEPFAVLDPQNWVNLDNSEHYSSPVTDPAFHVLEMFSNATL